MLGQWVSEWLYSFKGALVFDGSFCLATILLFLMGWVAKVQGDGMSKRDCHGNDKKGKGWKALISSISMKPSRSVGRSTDHKAEDCRLDTTMNLLFFDFSLDLWASLSLLTINSNLLSIIILFYSLLILHRGMHQSYEGNRARARIRPKSTFQQWPIEHRYRILWQ